MKKQEPIENEPIIMIDAKSEIYAVKETVPQSKVVNRLVRIRNSFEKMNEKFGSHNYLKVTTWLVNPTLFR